MPLEEVVEMVLHLVHAQAGGASSAQFHERSLADMPPAADGRDEEGIRRRPSGPWSDERTPLQGGAWRKPETRTTSRNRMQRGARSPRLLLGSEQPLPTVTAVGSDPGAPDSRLAVCRS